MKEKLPTIKSLEAKVWIECRRIIRAYYGNECISCGKICYGKDQQTGHLFRKKFLPLQMKYDLRLLRIQCTYCNLRLMGNEANYAANLVKQQGGEYLVDIADDIAFYKGEELDTKQKRAYLENLLERYKGM